MHCVPIPIYCDNSYQAELYVAWVVLEPMPGGIAVVISGPLRIPRLLWQCRSLEMKVPPRPPVTCLLNACRFLVQHTTPPPPRHLYSSLTGTFRDHALHAVHRLAREEGVA